MSDNITTTPATPSSSPASASLRATAGGTSAAPVGVLDRIGALLDTSGAVLPQSVENDDADVGEDTENPTGADYGTDDESDSNESDAAPDESQASGDDAQVDQSEPTESTIAAPTSWTADEKKLFATLPPDVQSTIARRETERDTATNQRMQQVAQERKAIEADREQQNQTRQNYANTINQLLSLTIPELQQVEQTDWVKLSQEDPAEYVRMSAVRDGLRNRVGFMQQQAQQAQQAQQQQMQAQYEVLLTDQYHQLVETVPEFRDPLKAKSLVSDIGSTLSNYGFTSQEIGAVADARMIRVAARLAQLEKQEAARKSAMAKKGGAPAPRMMTPSAAPAREETAQKKLADQFARLKRTGSPKDATRLLEQIL